MLRERDVPGGVNIGLIDQTARYALDSRYGVILERPPLLLRHPVRTEPYAVTPHGRWPMAKEVTPKQMHEWYRERDLLASIEQQIIKESSSLDERVARILTELLEARQG